LVWEGGVAETVFPPREEHPPPKKSGRQNMEPSQELA